MFIKYETLEPKAEGCEDKNLCTLFGFGQFMKRKKPDSLYVCVCVWMVYG